MFTSAEVCNIGELEFAKFFPLDNSQPITPNKKIAIMGLASKTILSLVR